MPEARISLYLAIGGQYALYEQSTLRLGGRGELGAASHLSRLVATRGGVDVGVLRWLGFRLEVRDFYTSKTALNVSTPGDGLLMWMTAHLRRPQSMVPGTSMPPLQRSC